MIGGRYPMQTILVAPTASPVGSLQIAARAVETGLHKLDGTGL